MGDDAAAARTGAPHAEQLADRFHLLLNAGDVPEWYLTRQHSSLREAVHTLNAVDAPRCATAHGQTDAG